MIIIPILQFQLQLRYNHSMNTKKSIDTNLAIIAAVDLNFAIGKNNTLPWHVKEDLQHFKHLSLDHTIIMGRKTFDSIGYPLPQRTNIVISRNPNLSIAGALVYQSLDLSLTQLPYNTKKFIIGGRELFQQSLDLVNKIYLTRLELEIENADVFFPQLDMKQWQEFESKTIISSNNIVCHFVTLIRR